ncbi:MAG: DUF5615 family PIN-like protein [Chloroflexota bacterium]|nr:DUF5615 family PIN-like protein [Chloroflexota bacterium]
MSDASVQRDEHMPSAIAVRLRRRGIDVLTADDSGLRGAADTEYFRSSLDGGRVLVTYDRHFLSLHNRQVAHAGIVYFPIGNRTIGEVIDALLLVQDVYSSEEMVGHLEYFLMRK